jgi:hypothetical protein
MRTTLEIDDDVIEAARNIARYKRQGIGKTLSDLARRGLTPETSPVVRVENGIPVWTHGPDAVSVTSEMVRNLADDE